MEKGEINALFDELQNLLINPREPDIELFDFMCWAMHPKWTSAKTFMEVAQSVCFGASEPSKSEIIRLVKSNALKWNGVKVTDPSMPLTWLVAGMGQWGVIQHGKKIFRTVLRRPSWE